MLRRLLGCAMVLVTATLISACASDPMTQSSAVSIDYGTVQAIETYRRADDAPLNAGTVLGGVAGGVLGHQIGKGSGNTAATIAGAIGGAVVGHEVEHRMSSSRSRVTVRLDSGSILTIDESREVELRVGDRVRIENNRISRL